VNVRQPDAAAPAPSPRDDEHAILVTREVRALLTVSRAVAGGGPLAGVLDKIAREAADVVGAFGAGVLLLTRDRLKLAGSYGLSADYGRRLKGTAAPAIRPGRGPSGIAVQEGQPIVIDDTDLDERVARWRDIAAGEGYRAMVSVPLVAESEPLGALSVYRATAGPWPPYQTALLSLFSDHAASAIRTAQLLEGQQQQLTAMSRLVGTLREQRHEHGNRIHAISGLLALGEYEEAQRFVASLEHAYDEFQAAILKRILNPTLAGLILSEMTIAHQRGISLTLDARSRLEALPLSLGEAEAVTIVGNLLHNAFDAVATMPKSRRRVKLLITNDGTTTVFKARDWGPGISADVEQRVFQRGFTTKDEHDGFGLALVAGAVASAGGEIALDRLSQGVSFLITIPNGS
jgi:signal transduction histidine kinase